MHRISHFLYCHWIQILLWIFFVASLWLFWRPVEILRLNKLTVYPTTVKTGDVIFARIDFDKLIMLPARTELTFYDDIMYPAISWTGNLSLGKHIKIVPIIIPYVLPSGKYKINYNVHYEMYLGTRIETYTFNSNEFTVVNSNIKDIANMKELMDDKNIRDSK